MTLQRALILLVLLVLAAGLVPAGIVLERRLGEALENRSREDLVRASMVMKDRWASLRDVRMMHAKEMSEAPGLADALARGDERTATSLLEAAASPFAEAPVLITGEDRAPRLGEIAPPRTLIERTRAGEMPVAVVGDSTGLHLLALAPVIAGDRWLGAVGGSSPIGEAEAGTLSGLTRSDVLLMDPAGRVLTSTLPPETAQALAARLPAATGDSVHTVPAVGRSFLAAVAPVDLGLAPPDREGADAPGRVAFVRDLQTEMAVLPELRRTALVATGLAVAFALLVGVLFAAGLSRPVSALARAADRFRAGDVQAPLVRSSITEVRRVSDAFAEMRETLAARLEELEEANRELADRQERLSLLQAELVQRERVAASGRLLTQLAHEIRNPVASVRNCMEVVRRKGNLTGEAREFADMAVDELLRMHELAEQMLELHRPRRTEGAACDPGKVAREVALLVRAGGDEAAVSVVGSPDVEAAMPEDALKQVLMNLVLNAREIADGRGPVEIVLDRRDDRVTVQVLDRGPGIPDEALDRIFDPFFTTKDEVHGVGLGLFTAEALVRTYGGTVGAANRSDGPGARFTVELPVAS